jgi:hypothetical protein
VGHIDQVAHVPLPPKAPTVAMSARNDSADVGVPATAAAPPLVTGQCDCYVER